MGKKKLHNIKGLMELWNLYQRIEIYQDDKDPNVFYLLDPEQIIIKKPRGRPPKHPWNPKPVTSKEKT